MSEGGDVFHGLPSLESPINSNAVWIPGDPAGDAQLLNPAAAHVPILLAQVQTMAQSMGWVTDVAVVDHPVAMWVTDLMTPGLHDLQVAGPDLPPTSVHVLSPAHLDQPWQLLTPMLDVALHQSNDPQAAAHVAGQLFQLHAVLQQPLTVPGVVLQAPPPLDTTVSFEAGTGDAIVDFTNAWLSALATLTELVAASPGPSGAPVGTAAAVQQVANATAAGAAPASALTAQSPAELAFQQLLWAAPQQGIPVGLVHQAFAEHDFAWVDVSYSSDGGSSSDPGGDDPGTGGPDPVRPPVAAAATVGFANYLLALAALLSL